MAAGAGDPDLTGHVRLDLTGLAAGLARARTLVATGMTRVSTALRGGEDGSNRLGAALGRVGSMAGRLGGVALAGGKIAAAVGAAVPLVAGLVATLANVAPAAGLAATGVIALGTANAALRLGMQGLDEAFKNAFDPEKVEQFNEAMAKLAPNARSFVTTVQELKPVFDRVQLQTQNALFQGLSASLRETATAAGPALSSGVTQGAGALNQMARGVLAAAANLGRSGTLGQAISSATAGLRNMSGLPATIVQGLVQVGAAAGPSFERLSQAGGSAVERFSQRMTRAFESGAMQRSIERAIGLLGQMKRIAENVGSTIGSIFSAAGAGGGGMLTTLERVTAELAKIMQTDGVQAGLRSLFETMGTLASTAAPLLGQALAAIGPVLEKLGPPLQILIQSLGQALQPIIAELGPVLGTAAEAVGALMVAISPLLPVIGELIAALLPALQPLLAAARDVFVALAPVVAQLADTLSAVLAPILAELPEIIRPFADMIAQNLTVYLRILQELLVALTPALIPLAKSFADLMVAVSPLIALVAGLAGQLLGALMPVITPIIRLVGQLASILAGRLASIITGVVVPAVRILTSLLRGDFSGAWSALKSAVSGAVSQVVQLVIGLPGRIIGALSPLGGKLASAASSAGGRFLSATGQWIASAVEWIASLPSLAAGALAGIGSALWNAGADLIRGFIGGIRSMIPSVQGVLGGITDSLTSWKGPPAKDARLLTPAGRLLIQGFIRGITSTTPALRRTLRDVTGDLAGYVRSGLVPGLTGSAAQIKSTVTKVQGLIRKAYITDMQKVIDAASKKMRGASKRQQAALRQEIATARGVQRAGGQVLRQVAIQSEVLKRAAKARDAVAAQLKTAQDKLKDVQKQRADKAASVRDGILGGADITAGGGTVNSVSAITVGLQLAAKKAQGLTANLAALRKRGLRNDLLDDIGSKGLDGAATAEALARATPAELKRINDLQAQLAKSAGAAGTTVAGALYDSGVRAAQGLVDGLKKKQKSIEDQMRRIAESMAKAIKKSLGIRSPSRVGVRLGERVGDGLALGAARSRAAVAAAYGALADAATRAAGVAGRAMAGVPQPGALTAAYAGASAAGPTTNNFYLSGGDASPDGILRALSWRGLVGGR